MAKSDNLHFSVQPCGIDELDSNDELLQTGFWAGIKAGHGWKPFAFALSSGKNETRMLVLVKNLGPGISLGYVPFGPDLPEPRNSKAAFLVELGIALRGILPRHVSFLRFDLPWSRTGEGHLPTVLAESTRLHKAQSDIQPASTVIIDIAQDDDGILESMKPKTRYNIRLASKKGVVIEEGSEDDLVGWYALYKETSERDRISIHSFDYYRSIYFRAKEYSNKGTDVKLLLARADGSLIAGIVIARNKKRGYYLYGASSNEKRNYMPNHALQWEAMRLLRNSGCTSYDLFGIPSIQNPSDPMYGLYQFKTGFGGIITNRYGCYDVVQQQLTYRLYATAEKLRRYYYKTLLKSR